MIRPNTIVAVGASEREVDYDYADGVSLHLGWIDDGGSACVEVFNPKAELELKVKVARSGSRLTIKAEGCGKPWRLVLRAIAADEVAAVENGHSAESELGAVIHPDRADRVTITCALGNKRRESYTKTMV